MIFKAFKIFLVIAIVVAAYKAAVIYAGLKMVDHTEACVRENNICETLELNLNRAETAKVVLEVNTCIKKKQSILDAWFFSSDGMSAADESKSWPQIFREICAQRA
jgi:hypothetical protein